MKLKSLFYRGDLVYRLSNGFGSPLGSIITYQTLTEIALHL